MNARLTKCLFIYRLFGLSTDGLGALESKVGTTTLKDKFESYDGKLA